MIYALLVSTSPTRRPHPLRIEAEDGAAAAHAAALRLHFPTPRPWVHRRRQGWIVTDGVNTHHVAILSETQ